MMSEIGTSIQFFKTSVLKDCLTRNQGFVFVFAFEDLDIIFTFKSKELYIVKMLEITEKGERQDDFTRLLCLPSF